MSTFLFVLLLTVIISHTCSSLECLNENGQSVEWFFIYKVNKGLDYSYYDATNNHRTLTVTNGKVLSDKNTALARTLNQIWQHPKSYNFIAYNVCFINHSF